MPLPFVFVDDLAAHLPSIPDDSIISRTVHQDERTKCVLFGFASGQELSEHTAARPAVLYLVSGEADVTLGEESFTAHAGTFVHMEPHVPHSIHALTKVVMLLLLL